jgi:uncharacterized protein (DUF58 family)
VRLTVRGWGLLGSSVGCCVAAYTTGLAELLYTACFLGLLPLSAIVVVRTRRRRLTVTRTFLPSVVSAGSVAGVSLTVTNLSPGASGPVSWVDRVEWPPGTGGDGTLPALAGWIPGGGNRGASARLRYSLRPPTRGTFIVGPLEIKYSDPFGLAIGGRSVGGTERLSVIPAIAPLGTGGLSTVAGDGAARVPRRRTSGNDDDLMTREYRSGDALRRVHWRASARHGELMVRQEEHRTYPEARLLIDTRARGYVDLSEDGGDGRMVSAAFEWGVRMVASMGVHLHRSGFRVEVLETAPRQIAPFGGVTQGSGADLEFLVSLASVRLDTTAPPEPGTSFAKSSPHGRSRVPGAVAAAAAERAGVLGTEHAEVATGPVFAVVSDPDRETLQWISAQRRPYESGVAFVVGQGSSRTADALSAAGWLCVAVHDSDDPALVWDSIERATGRSLDGGF